MSFDFSKFDPRNGDNIIRITAGLFMFPHVMGKITGYEATLVFFTKAGFYPPAFFLVLAGVMEAVSGLCLVFGLWTRFAAPVAAGALFVAAGALWLVGGFHWVWNKGGFEYPIFWGLICLAITVKEWMPQVNRWFPRFAA